MKKSIFLMLSIVLPFIGYTQSSMVWDFSWKDMHNKDYTTPVQDQVVNGPCAIFASCEAIEAMYSIHYNLPDVNINLAERFTYSVRGISNPYSISVSNALTSLKDTGVVFENDYPYINDSATGVAYDGHYYWGNAASSFTFNLATESPYLKINSWTPTSFGSGSVLTETIKDNLKRAIINEGPVVVNLNSPGVSHNVLFTGWSYNGSITTWEFMSSMDIGVFDYGVNNLSDSNFSIPQFTYYTVRPSSGAPFQTIRGCSTTVTPVDDDEDGYYVWGRISKPANSGIYALQDGDDDNPILGPRNTTTGKLDTICNINEDDMLITSGPSYVCPNTDYELYFSWPENATYKEIEISGQASIVSGGTSWIIVLTDVSFGYFQIKMKAKNAMSCDWTEKTFPSYWYDYYNCNKSATINDLNLNEGITIDAVETEFKIDEGKFNVYPNPVCINESFAVTLKKDESINRLELFDMQGKLYKTYLPMSTKKIVSTAGFTTGTYILKATSSENKAYKKIIIIE